MRLTAKLLLVFFVAILIVTSVYGYLSVLREEQIFAERAHAEVERLAAALEPPLRDLWGSYGSEGAIQVLQSIRLESQSVRIRWVWFDLPQNDPMGPSLPLRFESFQYSNLVSIPTKTSGDADFLYAYWPLEMSAPRRGGLEFIYSLAELGAAKRSAIVQTLRLLAALVGVTGLTVSLAGFRMAGNPLRQLIDKTQRIADGDLAGPLRLETGDELSQLANSLNELCQRLNHSQSEVERETAARVHAVEQLRHADRLRTVGQLASGIAHELGTPLNVISGRAELIAAGSLQPEKMVESAAAIKKESDRMAGIIRQVLDFARRRETPRTHFDLTKIVIQTVELLAPLAAERNVAMHVEPSQSPLFASVDATQIQQVLTNIIVNSIQASRENETIQVSMATVAVDPLEQPEPNDGKRIDGKRIDGKRNDGKRNDGKRNDGKRNDGKRNDGKRSDGKRSEFICIAVEDTGVGIAENDLGQVFEPFFTTKGVGEGTGLGLSIAYRIVKEHNGWIQVQSRVGTGTRFEVFLPQSVEP